MPFAIGRRSASPFKSQQGAYFDGLVLSVEETALVLFEETQWVYNIEQDTKSGVV